MVVCFYYFKAVPKVQFVIYTIFMCPLKNVCASFILDGLCYQ